ncbi:hypothetical protein GCM10009744_35740 [Kribbella alba]|uniref:Uncharacterized protein n=1 Tax=Kribbella alba TaxID=190197 RepID=A0ABN2FF80_9ACTN
MFPLLHHGLLLPESKDPFKTRSYCGASAGAAWAEKVGTANGTARERATRAVPARRRIVDMRCLRKAEREGRE